MSRQANSMYPMVANPDGSITEHPTVLIGGSDHVLGRFFDIIDRRYAGSPKDEQGEGYLFEWSELFGISTNLIGLNEDSMKDMDAVLEAVEKYLTEIKVI